MNFRFERDKARNGYEDFDSNTRIIWHPSQVETYYDKPQNAFCNFRKDLFLKNEVESANIRVFADTRYCLYVNGIYIARGPSRSDPRWQYYDEIDVSAQLKKGENIIAVAVIHYGYGTGQSMHRIPALFLECRVNEHIIIGTDDSWKCKISNAYETNVPRVNGCKGPIEIFDARKDFCGWQEHGFDDKDWDFAQARWAPMSPFWNLLKRPIPMLEEADVKAQRILNYGIGENVTKYDLKHLHWQIKEETNRALVTACNQTNTSYVFDTTKEGKFQFATFDFGKIEVGFLQLEVNGCDGDIIDIVYSEDMFNEKPEINGVNYRPIGRFILKTGNNKLETLFNWEAFRYIRIIARNYNAPVEIKSVGIKTRYYPMKDISSFQCENKELEKIWDISVHTLRLCMQDGFLDSPSREQQQWMGDGRFQAVINNYICGDTRMHEKLLRQIAQSQDYDGMTTSRYPDENHNLPPIPSFCLQWICSFYDYYEFTGSTDLIFELWNHILKGIRWFSGFENKDGLLEDVPYWMFIDWGDKDGIAPDVNRGGILSSLNMMYLEGVQSIVKMAKLVGDCEAADYFSKKEALLKDAIVNNLWDEDAGAYPDCKVEGEFCLRISEFQNILALLVINCDDEKADSIMKNVFDPKTRRNFVMSSPYFMLPYIRAMIKAGRCDIAVSEIIERYKPMIDAGATSVWERWSLVNEANGQIHVNSSCHAWASAPVVLVAEGLLGINVRSGKKVARPLENCINFTAHIVTPSAVFDIKRRDKKTDCKIV